MKELFNKIFEKIEFKVIVMTIYIGSLILIFIPEKFIEMLGLLEFKNAWKTVISSVFLIITCYYLALFFEFIFKKIEKNFINMKLYKIMKRLSLEEKQYLIEFYNHKTKKFNTSNEFDISDADANLLVAKNIIARGSNIAIQFSLFDYYLQPWAYEYLEKKLKNKTLIIEEKSFTWKD